MPDSAVDTLRILVSTDNHVGYNERDAIRGDDSWKSFHEVMCLAKERDVDMVILAGDLFHENKPSRQAMYQVMRSLRMNCYGEKPCEVAFLSDGSQHFKAPFNHVNYEDPDINISIPVFSIHGNHDDPSGDGHFAALDLLAMSGLLNYYGEVPEADNIEVKPILLQKGSTKVAMYGLSNVRDERLFRTFRDGNVKFFRPGTQREDWLNILSVHQNHHAYTETGYLPENFLPDYMDLVIWGHEHECKIEPPQNPNGGFRVMQPGSSVATSLVPGEAVPKKIAILNVCGRDMDIEYIRLKTVRPFIYKEIILSDYKQMTDIALMQDNQAKVHAFLEDIVNKMIEKAREDWLDRQRESGEESDEEPVPLPLIRLRVEITAPDGGHFSIENPQRFSNRFIGKVANQSDVIQTYRKRAAANRAKKGKADMPNAEVMAQMSLDTVKVEKLVKEFLTAQSLSILPQNQFSESVGQFVDKDDKNAMLDFVDQSMDDQQKQLLAAGGDDFEEEQVDEMMERFKLAQEEAYARGEIKRKKTRTNIRPQPDGWDSELYGDWEDDPAAIIRSDDDDEGEGESREASVAPSSTSRGRGRGRGSKVTAGTTRKKAPAAKKAPAKKAPAKASTARSRKKQASEDEESEEEDDDDVIMLDDDDDDDDEEALFVRPAKRAATTRSSAASKAAPKASTRGAKTPAASTRQSQLSFASQANGSGSTAANKRPAASRRLQEPSDDEISDDDAFEPPPTATTTRATRR